VVRPDAVNLVSRLVRHFDEPFGDSSAIPTFIVSEFAVQHVKVALSGDGGDELFAGYDRFQAHSTGRGRSIAFRRRCAHSFPGRPTACRIRLTARIICIC
jgi:asparagine synthetase B (glutamine-hydrolysing)